MIHYSKSESVRGSFHFTAGNCSCNFETDACKMAARIVPKSICEPPCKDRSILQSAQAIQGSFHFTGNGLLQLHVKLGVVHAPRSCKDRSELCVCEVPCKERFMMRRAGTTQLSLASLPRSVTNNMRSKGYELRAHHFCVGSHSANWVEVGAHVISMAHVHWSDLHANGRAPSAMIY